MIPEHRVPLRMVIIVTALIYGVLSAHAATTIDADNQKLQYAGRIDFSNPKAVKFIWASSSVTATFEGSSIAMSVSSTGGENEFVSLINGKETKHTVNSSSPQSIPIASGLSSGPHTVSVWLNWGVGMQKPALVFHGFSIDDGASLLETDPPSIRIEAYGNSVTEGTTTGGFYTFPAVAARELGASVSNVGISGLAVLDNTGHYNSQKTGLQSTYDKLIPPPRSTVTWNFRDYVPDLLIFCMGINDMFAGGFSNLNRWVTEYKEIVKDIHSRYGNNPTILFYPLNRDYAGLIHQNVKIVKDALEAEGYQNVYFGTNDFYYEAVSASDNTHPTVKGANDLGKALAQFIAENGLATIDSSIYEGKYKLTLENKGNGTVSASPQGTASYYDPGTEITLSAEPAARMVFNGWSGAISSSDKTTTFTINQDATITAQFGPDPNAPLLLNGDFSNGSTAWEWFQHEPGSGSLSTTNGSAEISIVNPGTEIWHTQLLQQDLAINGGETLQLSFYAKAQQQRTAIVTIKYMQPAEHKYLDTTITLGTTMQTYTFTFTADQTPQSSVRLEVNFGGVAGDSEFDNFSLSNKSSTATRHLIAAQSTQKIQAGVFAQNGVLHLQGINPTAPWSLKIFDLQGNLLIDQQMRTGNRSFALKKLRISNTTVIVQLLQGANVSGSKINLVH